MYLYIMSAQPAQQKQMKNPEEKAQAASIKNAVISTFNPREFVLFTLRARRFCWRFRPTS